MRSIARKSSFSPDPFRFFDLVGRDLDRIFNMEPATQDFTHGFRPAVDFADKETHYELNVDLPGMRKEDVHVEAHDGRLRISGERKTERKDGDYTERRWGRFERVLTLPDDINIDQIDAKYENGVLSLALPKDGKAKSRKIDISENGGSFWKRLLGEKTSTES